MAKKYLSDVGLRQLIEKIKVQLSTIASQEAYPKAEMDTKLAGKAPTAHASTATTYGEATMANYGHTKLSTDSGAAAIGTSGSRIGALRYEAQMSSITPDFNSYRTPGEWYFYASSATNAPPFTTGSGSGFYLKVMQQYSNTYCTQMCWRRQSDEIWIRYSTSATAWSAWKQIATAEFVQNALKGRITDKVWAETSTSQTARTVTIDGVTSWDDVLNVPLRIKAATYGTNSAATLNINGLGAKNLYFPSLTGSGVTTTPQYYWVRESQVYEVVWDGTNLVVLNMQVRGASTSYAGIVQLSSSTASTSTTLAATASAVKAVNDRMIISNVDLVAGSSTLATDTLYFVYE